MINRILELMKLNNINASTLTAEAKLTSSSISDWKSGKSKPSTDAVAKIANYFNVSTDYIILGKDSNNSITERERDLLSIFRKIESEKIQDRFIGKAEIIMEEMIKQEPKRKASS